MLLNARAQIGGCVFLISILIALNHEMLQILFAYNPWINSTIIGCFLGGIILPFYYLSVLQEDKKFVHHFFKTNSALSTSSSGAKLFHIQSFLGQFLTLPLSKISLDEMQTLQSIAEDRLHARHIFSKYLIKIVVLLGLLGTFWGLIQTIGAISRTMTGLNTSHDLETSSLFQQLIQGIRSPLSGMGIAFSSSILGLTASLILGFFDLLQSKAEKKFCNLLETELYAKHRAFSLSSCPSNGTAYIMSLLEQSAETLNLAHEKINQIESLHVKTLSLIKNFVENQQHNWLSVKDSFSEAWIHAANQQFKDMAQQIELYTQSTIKALEKNSQSICNSVNGEIYKRSLEPLIEGQKNMTEELRKEIRLITKTLSLLAEPIENSSEESTQPQLKDVSSA